MPAKESRIPASSSTTRMLCMLGSHRCRRGVGNNWKFNDEPRAHRSVLFHANGAMMIFDNSADNREPESSAAFLGREIRQEKSFLKFAGHAVARVGDGNFNGVAARHQGRRDFDFSHDRIL